MGGCQTNNGADNPKPITSILENKFKSLPKHRFMIPSQINQSPLPITSNGKITDFITKNHQHIRLQYQQLDIGNSLGSDHKFVDPEFSNSNVSLGKKDKFKEIDWKRPENFIKNGQYSIFEGKIEPKDIRQGKLGNCYFLSAIVSISEYPFIIRRLFQSVEISSYGYYGVWLFIDGVWRCILLDDYFPTFKGKPYYSKNNGPQIWVLLLEKAYAKVFGNYEVIEKGLTGIALNAFTGAPFQYFIRDSHNSINVEDAWHFITLNIAKRYLVTGSTQNSDRNQNIGLVSSHAYSILQAQTVFVATKKGKIKERILKMRNPWGKFQWKGKWSDYSDIWSEQLRNQLGCKKADDGIFWISIEDFIENFGQICVCKYNKNYISTSLKLNFSKKSTSQFKGVYLRVKNRTEGYISVIQKDSRHLPQKLYEYAMVRLIILKIDKYTQTITKFIGDAIDCDRDTNLEIQLEPGDYYVVVEADWKSSYSRQLVINYYGQQSIILLEDQDPGDVEGLFNQIIMLYEKENKSEDSIYIYEKDKNIKRFSGLVAGYKYYHYINKSTYNNYLNQTVFLKGRQHIEVFGEKSKDYFTVKLFPQQQRIVKLRILKQGNSFYSFSTTIKNHILEKYSLQKLKDLTDKKPTKIKKRQIDSKQIEVIVKTYSYGGGIAILYQNMMNNYAYSQDMTVEMSNLELENERLDKKRKISIELQPFAEKLLSFVVIAPGKQTIFKTQMVFQLNTPEFKF